MRENNFEHYFGSFEKMVDYIADACNCDCYVCQWPISIPCFKKFMMTCTKEDIEKWLLSEYMEGK